ncbi:MAG: OmpA family protein [Bacteroidales bacterium]|nr:OmpA family protein [Bacteroidales bacterium]
MKQLISIINLFILCFLFSKVFSQSFTKDFIDKFYTAELLLDKGNFNEAIKLYSELLSQDTLNANINFKIGFCYLNLPQYYEKIKSISFLEFASKNIDINADVGNPSETSAPLEALYFLAKAYHLNYMPEKALIIIDSLINIIQQYNIIFSENINELKFHCKNLVELMKNPLKTDFKNLGNLINTEYDEHSPVITADEQTLIFTSKRFNQANNLKTIDNQYFEDIYISHKQAGNQWSEPTALNKVNGPKHDASVGLSPDGSELYIYKDESSIINPDDGNLYVSKLMGEEWSAPQKLNINTKYNENHASISADGQELYFTSNRPGGFGGLDIYVSKRLPNGEWGTPINLGPQINTEQDEISPFIHPDGVTLFFSSKGHKTIGGFDIFFSEKDENDNWSNPTNIGYPINTPGDDAFFILTPDGKHAYYATERQDGFGRADIYYITFPEKEEKTLAVISGTIKLANNRQPQNVKIYVYEDITNKLVGEYKPNPTTGKYLFILKTGKRYIIKFESDIFIPQTEYIDISDSMAYVNIEKPITLNPISLTNLKTDYYFRFQPNTTQLNEKDLLQINQICKILNYLPEFRVIIINSSEQVNPLLNEVREQIIKDYLTDNGISLARIETKNSPVSYPNTLNIYIIAKDSIAKLQSMPQLTSTEIEKKLDIKFKTADNKLIIYPVYFSFNQYICEFNIQNLINIANWLKKNPKAKIELIGHTDAIGTDEYNMKLSKKRAEYVMNQLIDLGINKERIKITAMGKKKPISTNDTPQGRQLNRRVEFKILNYSPNDIILKDRIEFFNP